MTRVRTCRAESVRTGAAPWTQRPTVCARRSAVPTFPRSHVSTFPRSHVPTSALLVTVALLTAPALVPPARADSLPRARQRDILREALNAYDEAIGVVRSDPARAAQLYRQAAAGFHALRDAGLRSAALEYNLGNVHFRVGQLGRAVLHYRRAQRLAPGDERLAANLRYARNRVEPAIAPSGQSRLTRQLLFWHYNTSLRQRFWALVVLSALGWPLLFIWLRARRRPLLLFGLSAAALALACGASLGWQMHEEARHPHAVVVGEKTHLRLGRGEGSDLAIREPLGPGVELRTLQQRGDWVEVRLRNDQTGWLPAAAVERI